MNTFLDYALLTLASIIFFTLTLLLIAAGILYWIAKGSPDVNGDPERDAYGDDPWPLKCHLCQRTLRPGRGRHAEWIICLACQATRDKAKISDPAIPQKSCDSPPGSPAAGIVTARVRGSGAENLTPQQLT